MPIVQPTSGSIILPADIEAMHEAVRDVANAQGPTTVSRGTFGPQHMPSLLLASDVAHITAPVTVTTVPNPWDETIHGIKNHWQDLTAAGYHLHNGGAGYDIDADCILVMYATFNISKTDDVQVPLHWHYVLAVNLWYQVNAIDVISEDNTRIFRAQLDPHENGYFGATGDAEQLQNQHDDISIWHAYEIDNVPITGLTFDSFTVHAACADLAAEGTAVHFIIDHGSMGFFVLAR
jgi:hypothetical protein